VLSLVLIVLGVVGFQRLEILFFPKLVMPIVTVYTHYRGASAELMESQVTTRLENAIAGVDNIASMSSSSWTGGSNITVQFRLGGDFESEAAQVRDKVAGERQKLPTDADAPSITVGTKGPELLDLAILDEKMSPQDIRDYTESYIQPMFRQLAGVGRVSIEGASDYAMRIWLDAGKMAAMKVTVSDVKSALLANNIYFPAGTVRDPTRSYSIVSNTQLKNPSQFADIIVRHSSSGTIYLKDIATVKLGDRSFTETPMLINGKKGILLRIYPLQSANPLTVASEIKKELASLQHNLPPGMTVSVAYDASQFLKQSIDETFASIAEAVVLVILVVVLFLGSLRASLIPIVTIPVSIISVFGLIYVLDFSINIMSLLGIVLSIGLVVDDAIVMLENIHRHIEQGMAPLQAALTGSREITGAVMAMSLTLVAVYAPIGMVQGFTSALFREFAFTLAGAVLISAFVALTLSPMMCSRILLAGQHQNKLADKVDRLFSWLTRHYQALLRGCLKARYWVLLSLLLIGLLGWGVFKSLSSEFLPKEDFGIFNVSVSAPTGANINYTLKYMAVVEQILKKVPEVSKVINQINNRSASLMVTLKPWGQRTRSTQEIIQEINPQLKKIPGIDANASMPDIVSYGEQGADVTYNVMTARDYSDLLGPIDKMIAALRQYPGAENVHTNLKFDAQKFEITVDRDLAAVMGVNIQDLADTVSAMMSGNHWSDVQSGKRSYEVIVQMQKKDLMNFGGLNKLYVRGQAADTGDATMVPISSLIALSPIIRQGSLTHFNRMRSGYITASVAPGYTESNVIDYMEKMQPDVLTRDTRAAFSGKAKQFIESSGGMVGLVVMAFVFIYLVLSAQFGSFLDPFIILFAVPFSMVGALLFLKLGGGTFNLYSQIGIVTLIGLISKHGILITQFINQLRRDGETMTAAIISGASIRLRPILMTTAAMVFGTLPLMLASGPGSIGRQQIGLVVVGGLICGTFFSLVVVPIIYSILGRWKRLPTKA
jgi:hydrophobe/amphiphile efflux-1 (HAE1) family protein